MFYEILIRADMRIRTNHSSLPLHIFFSALFPSAVLNNASSPYKGEYQQASRRTWSDHCLAMGAEKETVSVRLYRLR
jgi:hypothetical protein